MIYDINLYRIIKGLFISVSIIIIVFFSGVSSDTVGLLQLVDYRLIIIDSTNILNIDKAGTMLRIFQSLVKWKRILLDITHIEFLIQQYLFFKNSRLISKAAIIIFNLDFRIELWSYCILSNFIHLLEGLLSIVVVSVGLCQV